MYLVIRTVRSDDQVASSMLLPSAELRGSLSDIAASGETGGDRGDMITGFGSLLTLSTVSTWSEIQHLVDEGCTIIPYFTRRRPLVSSAGCSCTLPTGRRGTAYLDETSREAVPSRKDIILESPSTRHGRVYERAIWFACHGYYSRE